MCAEDRLYLWAVSAQVTFPPDYPFKAPSITMSTPNGRFATNTKLCLSFTDYHPESWNPLWCVRLHSQQCTLQSRVAAIHWCRCFSVGGFVPLASTSGDPLSPT
jgi:hypothetical protein